MKRRRRERGRSDLGADHVRRIVPFAAGRPIAALLVLAVLALGCGGGSSDAGRASGDRVETGTETTPAVDLGAVDWTRFEREPVAPPDRLPAPAFTLQDVAGRDVSLAEHRGKVVILNFWATWCGPCRREIPDFIEMTRELPGEEFVILGISVDREGLPKVAPFVESAGINYPVLVDGNRIAGLFGDISAIPTTFVLDKKGRIAARVRGLRPRSYFDQVTGALLQEG